MSRKPCGRTVPPIMNGRMPSGSCTYERAKGLQRCRWHWLMSQSSDVQAEWARKRLADYDKSWEAHVNEGRQARKHKADWPSGERWCSGCQSFVPLFYCSGSRCKACASMAAHAKRVETTYGISAAEYDRLYELQGGRCAICRNQSRTIRFAVDHDHQTQEVRGLLCKRCNHDLLGGGHDSVLMLWRALEYLLFPPAQMHCPPGATDPRPGVEVALEALRERLQLHAQLNAPKLRQVPPGDDPAPF